jgi:uncharacterized protein
MALDWTTGPLAEGLDCYAKEEFFAAHEHWEGVWLRCSEPERTFMQALIQIAAAFHHLQRQNPAGTRSLLKASLRRLEGYALDFEGIAVEPLRGDIRSWLEQLEKADPLPALGFPRIGMGRCCSESTDLPL